MVVIRAKKRLTALKWCLNYNGFEISDLNAMKVSDNITVELFINYVLVI